MASTPTNCLPWWHTTIAAIKKTPVNSGCPINSQGNADCAPEAMRKKAELTLQQSGWWPKDKALSLETYTLARYMTSEVGGGPPEERAAVGEAAVNRARLEKLPHGILSLLLYRQKIGSPNRGYYGPIHGNVFPAAPYGRWASTSSDPHLADLILADLILSGRTNNFSRGADDQAGMEYVKAFPHPDQTVKNEANKGNYWVGPLPGVNHWRTFLYRHIPNTKPSSPDGAALLQRGLAAVANRQAPDWSGLPICPRPTLAIESNGVRVGEALVPNWTILGGIGILTVAIGMALGRHAIPVVGI